MTKRRPTPRADANEIARRTDLIVDRLLAGESASKILRNTALRADLGNVEDRQVQTYISRAREEIAAQGEFDKVHEFGRAVARLNQLYGLAVEKGDLTAARQVVKDLCQMYGITGPIHVKVEGGVVVTNFAELWKAVEQDAGGEPTDG